MKLEVSTSNPPLGLWTIGSVNDVGSLAILLMSAPYTSYTDHGQNDTAGPPRTAAVVFLCQYPADALAPVWSRLQEAADKQVKWLGRRNPKYTVCAIKNSLIKAQKSQNLRSLYKFQTSGSEYQMFAF